MCENHANFNCRIFRQSITAPMFSLCEGFDLNLKIQFLRIILSNGKDIIIILYIYIKSLGRKLLSVSFSLGSWFFFYFFFFNERRKKTQGSKYFKMNKNFLFRSMGDVLKYQYFGGYGI